MCGYVMCADLHVTHYVDKTVYITQVPSLKGFSITFRLGNVWGFVLRGSLHIFLCLMTLHGLKLRLRRIYV